MMKKLILVKIVLYILFLIMFCSGIYIEVNYKSAYNLCSMILSFPTSAIITNIIHECGHMFFAIIFGCRISWIKIGVFKITFKPFNISLEDNGLLSGKCSLIIKDGMPLWKKHFVLMGGVYSNIVFLAFNMLMHFYFKDVITICIIFCCSLNILANGLYNKSPDRVLLNNLKSKI